MFFTIFFFTSGGDQKPPKTLEFSIFLFFISPVKKRKGCVGINFRAHLRVHFDFMKVVNIFF